MGGGSELDNLDLDLGSGGTMRGRSGTSNLNADDLLSSVEDLLSDPTMHQRDNNSKKQQEQQQASSQPAQEDSDEEDFPYLEPLPAQPPSLGDTEGYKAYMRLKYEWQQRENA